MIRSSKPAERILDKARRYADTLDSDDFTDADLSRCFILSNLAQAEAMVAIMHNLEVLADDIARIRSKLLGGVI